MLRWISCPSKPSILGIEGPQMSKSINPTSFPCAASANASCAENVLFPTPPFPDSTSTCGSPRQRDHPSVPLSVRSETPCPQPLPTLCFTPLMRSAIAIMSGSGPRGAVAHAACAHTRCVGRGAQVDAAESRQDIAVCVLRSRRWGPAPDSGSLHMRKPCPPPPRLCLHPDTQCSSSTVVNCALRRPRRHRFGRGVDEHPWGSPGQPALALSGVMLIASFPGVVGRVDEGPLAIALRSWFAPCRGFGSGSGLRLHQRGLCGYSTVTQVRPPPTPAMAAISCTLRPCVRAASAAPRVTANKALKVRNAPLDADRIECRRSAQVLTPRPRQELPTDAWMIILTYTQPGYLAEPQTREPLIAWQRLADE